ncbi:MAG: hypothetical protein HY351_01550, partial [Candidatus Omnitrophica bacterium]|nr:hypothetical protein [Candidatus Omnitrophota bacterium]
FNTSYKLANDYEFYLRLAKTHEIVLLAEPLFRYKWHSRRASWDVAKMFHEVREIAQSYADQPSEDHDQKNNLKKVHYKSAQYYYFLASEAYQFKNYGSAAWFYFRAVTYDPLVGDRMVKWSYFQNGSYRILRPYLAVVVSSFLFIFYGVIGKILETLFVHEKRIGEIKTK